MKKSAIFLLITIIALPVIWRIFGSGIYPVHDNTQVARVAVMGKALLNGQFPVRWVNLLGYGYGYPIFSFYSPLPYYIGGFINALGIDAYTASNIMISIGFLLAGYAMFILVSPWFGRGAGLVAAILYLYAPYHAVQVFVRGAVGELYSYAFLPLVPIYYLNHRQYRGNSFVITTLSLTGIILSHTISGYLMIATICTIVTIRFLYIITVKRKYPISHLRLIYPIFVALSLTAFFWLPAFVELNYTGVNQMIAGEIGLKGHFVCPDQLWHSEWGYGGSVPGCVDGMSFKLGKFHLLVALLGFLVLVLRKRFNLVVKLAVMVVSISVFMTLKWSSVLWDLIPGGNYVQYPWRMLTLTALGLSILGAGLIGVINLKPIRICLLVVFIIATYYFNLKLFSPQINFSDQFPKFGKQMDEDIIQRVSAISDEYMPGDFNRLKARESPSHDTISLEIPGQIKKIIDRETEVRIRINSNGKQKAVINRAYFPGWQYKLNGNTVVPEIINGLPVVQLEHLEYTLEMYLKNTPIRTIGNIVSLLAFMLLIIKYGQKNIC